ncbi:MAG: glycerophosphodiester phosphodiesterase [Gammaproteobacteria bacterium]|nr:glycerophosphodiester phosphodiesterase [Gammaproteobacteria bacterium]
MIIFGHRGAAGLAAENTLQSFRKALELGVDGIEFDVRFCGKGDDKALVVFHDKKVNRTTNGKGKLKNYSFDDLRKLDASCGRESGEVVPTLPEVCELIGETALINIELKGKGTAQAVMEYLLSKKNTIPLNRFIISSFKFKELKKVRTLSKEVKIGVLAERNYKSALAFSQKIVAYSFHSYVKNIKQKHIDKARKLGLKSYVFTVNLEKDFERLKNWKVDGVFTDFPDRIKS